MTMSEVLRGGSVSQATEVEKARAVAEVLAAVTVAQERPRDYLAAEAAMRQACSRLVLADRSFYAVQNRGQGPSIHLARALARLWRNLDYGVRELRRDDAAGESEVQAYAWDQETNVRTTRSFIMPHAKVVGKGAAKRREAIVDLDDIYRNNQNLGARAVRECIFALLPAEFVDEAETLCRQALDKGDGTPLPERIANAVARFEQLGVTVQRLEGALGGKVRGAWQPADLSELTVKYLTITKEGVAVDEVFPPDEERATAAKVLEQGAAARAEAEANAAKKADGSGTAAYVNPGANTAGSRTGAEAPRTTDPSAGAAAKASPAAATAERPGGSDRAPAEVPTAAQQVAGAAQAAQAAQQPTPGDPWADSPDDPFGGDDGMDDADRQAQEDYQASVAQGGIDLAQPDSMFPDEPS